MFHFKSLFLCLFVALMTGCGQYQMIDCSQEQEEYIAASIDWMHEHSDEIEGTMNGLWPKRQTSLASILEALANTPIRCGVGRNEEDSIAATTRHVPHDSIVLDIGHPLFVDGLRMYKESLYVMDHTTEELTNPEIVDPTEHSPMSDILGYHVSRSDVGSLLAHEGVHVLMGGHSPEVNKQIKQLASSQALDPAITGTLDETYGWGAAVSSSAAVVYTPQWDALVTAHAEQLNN